MTVDHNYRCVIGSAGRTREYLPCALVDGEVGTNLKGATADAIGMQQDGPRCCQRKLQQMGAVNTASEDAPIRREVPLAVARVEPALDVTDAGESQDRPAAIDHQH